ncbi:MAG: hypothetical protein WA993_07960 [Candidatus Binatus sp.]|jgi:hypothetical protein|uniref:hypothetical protein n=1 Tax=Candidatus Binatus sp. TaxID=2811406 RepID=UPI003CA019A2
MTLIGRAEIRAAVATLAITALFAAAPARAQSQAAAQESPAPASQSAAVPAASASPTAKKKTLRQEVRALVTKYAPERLKRDLEFKKAAALFPDFCHHWEQDLHEREMNNLSKLKFNLKDGFQTATYTAYGKVAACESHQSKDGYSIGKLTYEEFIYYLAGKSEDEARHALPKAISDTRTTEIFRWDNGKWFY